MGNKVNIFADIPSFLRLLGNPEFVYGRNLKYLIRQRADVFLIIDQETLTNRWDNTEDPLRKLCDSYDISCPHALPKLNEIYKNPNLCYLLDSFALWMLDTTDKDINRFRDNLGVWMVNPHNIKDDTFYMHHNRGYEKDSVIEGPSIDNGWANYIAEMTQQGKQLPPLNAIVINDRWLINNTNEKTAEKYGFYGLNNLQKLLDAILPKNLEIPFQLTIYCQHPQLDMDKTDIIVEKFKTLVKSSRTYPIEIEFIYGLSKHKRTFHSNYFLFDLDRGYNAFYWSDYRKLCGENDFTLESYHNDPFCTGDTNYTIITNKLKVIKCECVEIIESPDTSSTDYSAIKRCYSSKQKLQNRLFH